MSKTTKSAKVSTVPANSNKKAPATKPNQLPEPPKEVKVDVPANINEIRKDAKPTRDQIVALAKEVNHVLGTTISVKANVSQDVIQNQIASHADQLVSSDFVDGGDGKAFTEAASVLFTAIGVKVPTSTPPVKAGKADKSPEAIQAALDKKAADKKEKEEKEAKEKKEKADKKLADKVAKEREEAEAKAAKKAAVYTWTDATETAIRNIPKTGSTLAEIKDCAITNYKSRNDDSENVPKNVFRYMVSALVRFNILALSADGKYTTVAK